MVDGLRFAFRQRSPCFGGQVGSALPILRAILRSPPSTSPLVGQGDSFAGTLHTGPAESDVSNTPAFHGRANSRVDTSQTVPRGLTGDQPLRKWRIHKG